MKIRNILETTSYSVYIDLDGVLADFDVGMTKALNDVLGAGHIYCERTYTENPEYQKKMWDSLHKYQEKGNELWYNLELMHDAMELWEYLRPHTPQILSATGHPKHKAEEQKRRWVAEKLGEDVVVNITRKAADKATHSGENRILIDDKEKAIDPWRSAGGIGIVHTSAENTIRELKGLGI